MIKIKKEETKILSNKYTTIEIEGHANFAPKGYDIVCASVSILYQTLLLTLDMLDEKVERKGDEKIKMAIIRNPSHDANVLIDSFFVGTKAIAYSYPNYVQIV